MVNEVWPPVHFDRHIQGMLIVRIWSFHLLPLNYGEVFVGEMVRMLIMVQSSGFYISRGGHFQNLTRCSCLFGGLSHPWTGLEVDGPVNDI